MFNNNNIYYSNKYFFVGYPLQFVLLTGKFIKLVDVKGLCSSYKLKTNAVGNIVKIDRNVLELPGVIIDDFEDKIEQDIKPVFDTVWNACGYEKSRNYNNDGE